MINFFKRKFNKGFSLVEILIYLAIFTAVSILVINSFIIVVSTFTKIRSNHDLVNSGSNSLERISREIRQAKSIDSTSIFDSDSSSLKLVDPDGNIIVFDKNLDDLRISKNGEVIGNLLVNNVSLDKLIFKHIVTANSEAIKIEIEIEDTNSKISKVEKFYDTVVLRGSY